jgi:YidC/Oxa1 family membrane protein insertase
VILPLANILQPLIDVADSIIKFFHDDVGFSWGIAIIALTFTVRVAVLPLSLRGIRSMRRMQLVAPKIQALKEKYKDDPQRFQRETMELYKKEGVNPFSSCLPFILQIPFFIAIYQLLRGDTFQADVMASPPPGFLFVKSVIEAPQGAELIVLIVLFVTTTAASVLLTTATSPTASPAQRRGSPFTGSRPTSSASASSGSSTGSCPRPRRRPRRRSRRPRPLLHRRARRNASAVSA